MINLKQHLQQDWSSASSILNNIQTGGYRVNDRFFEKKIDAILYANETLANIDWVFNNNVFDSIDWTVEPAGSLDEFYKKRALQIRQQYDYIVIMFSGGSDSLNVLMSFLENDIKVDEIIISAPLSGLKGFTSSATDFSASNMVSETFLAQLPLTERFSKQHPNIKITVNDYFKDIVDAPTDDWIFEASLWFHPSAKRHSLENIHHLKQLSDSGKTIAKVYGIDKPNLYINPFTRNVYSVLSDSSVQVGVHQSTRDNHNITPVMFYWTPDMPELVVKQSHVLARWLFLPEQSWVLKYVASGDMPDLVKKSESRVSAYQRSIIPCIYPIIKPIFNGVFQSDKCISGFALPKHDWWLKSLYGEEKFIQKYYSDTRNFLTGIDRKYFDNVLENFLTFTHPRMIGTIDQFTYA